jgi:RNA polymerase sigma factor (sigma-70 family)
MMPNALEGLARKAIDGDREALDHLIEALQGDVYGLALRMVWNREDAEDATQEILVRIVTRLAQFDFRSKLKTWIMNDRQRSRARNRRLAAARKSRSTVVHTGRVRARRRTASSWRSTTISSSLKSFDRTRKAAVGEADAAPGISLCP